jgi:hypothetical protein
MIIESSKDYAAGRILILFKGEVPTQEEINEYCHLNYGFRPGIGYTIEPENDFRGFINPGTVIVDIGN